MPAKYYPWVLLVVLQVGGERQLIAAKIHVHILAHPSLAILVFTPEDWEWVTLVP